MSESINANTASLNAINRVSTAKLPVAMYVSSRFMNLCSSASVAAPPKVNGVCQSGSTGMEKKIEGPPKLLPNRMKILCHEAPRHIPCRGDSLGVANVHKTVHFPFSLFYAFHPVIIHFYYDPISLWRMIATRPRSVRAHISILPT